MENTILSNNIYVSILFLYLTYWQLRFLFNGIITHKVYINRVKLGIKNIISERDLSHSELIFIGFIGNYIFVLTLIGVWYPLNKILFGITFVVNLIVSYLVSRLSIDIVKKYTNSGDMISGPWIKYNNRYLNIFISTRKWDLLVALTGLIVFYLIANNIL